VLLRRITEENFAVCLIGLLALKAKWGETAAPAKRP
jgi:hypothetical protein